MFDEKVAMLNSLADNLHELFLKNLFVFIIKELLSPTMTCYC